MSITSQIASWTTNLNQQPIPDATYHAALRSLYNYLGCTLHGSQHPTVHPATKALQPFFGQPTSTVIGTIQRTDAQHAALLNGISSHVHDYDDTHLATIIHPTTCIASALLAYTQHVTSTTGAKISGKTLLTALIAGIEVACKLGIAVYPTHYDIGWHITSTTGSIGAAVAVAQLMSLDDKGIQNAIGIAATQVTGLRCNFGSDTKPFHAGRAAQNGLLAALLAEEGFTSDAGSIEAKRGWANVVTGGLDADCNRDASIQRQVQLYVGELGTVWEVEKNSFKPFPCGIVAHPAIDAAIQLRAKIIGEGPGGEGNLGEELNKLKLRVQVHPLVVELTGNKAPTDGLQAKFSVYHGAAVGLLYGKAGPAEYEDDIVTNSDVVRIRESIEVVPSDDTRSDEAKLWAYEPDSSAPVHVLHVEHAVGSLDVPMTDQQLEAKFVDQVALDLSRDAALEMSRLCWGIGDVGDVNEVLNQLVP